MTTWGDLRVGDVIADAAGREWKVYSHRPSATVSVHAEVGISDGSAMHVVTKPAAEAVTLLRQGDLREMEAAPGEALPEVPDSAYPPDATPLLHKGQHCQDCNVDGEDPHVWCDCQSGEPPCKGPCKQRSHAPRDCPTLKAAEAEALADAARVVEAFGADRAELAAVESDAERGVREAGGPYPPGHQLTDLQMRSHLFLVHGQYVGDVSNHAALMEHHRRGHEIDDGVPHTHEEG